MRVVNQILAKVIRKHQGPTWFFHHRFQRVGKLSKNMKRLVIQDVAAYAQVEVLALKAVTEIAPRQSVDIDDARTSVIRRNILFQK